MKRLRWCVLLLLLLLVPPWLIPAGREAARAAPGAPVPDRVCVKCHQDVSLAGISHEVLGKLTPDGACESCHGAGAEHAADPFEKRLRKDVEPGVLSGLCLACHRSGPDHVTGWAESKFAKAGQTCGDCHEAHKASTAHFSFPADDRGYVGDDSCRLCHSRLFGDFAASIHAGVIDKPGGGCEACHGPGRDHALAAREHARGEGPSRIVAKPGQDSCVLCHRAIPARHAAAMPVYAEKRNDCTVCHDAHASKTRLYATGEAPSSTCADCHVAAIESMASSVHGSLMGEGGPGCAPCHAPGIAHVQSGGRAEFVRNLLDEPPGLVNEVCLSCHRDAPDHARDWKGGALDSRGLTCLTCHEAHGDDAAQGKPVLPEGVEVVEGAAVGAATCAVCHQAPHPGIERSAHAKLAKDGGCETCHGPGSAHVMSGGVAARIRNPGNLPKAQRADFCLACHGNEGGLRTFDRGEHGRSGLTCTDCHDALAPAGEGSRKTEPDLCFACHQDVRASFNLRNRHPLDRGAVSCSDCHDPHSEVHGFLNLEARKERCLECHEDKRGPFLYEHEADRQDGCMICHLPHGSMNRRLLTHREVRTLCIQCHLTPQSHDVSPGSPFRNCLNCHGSIHGSYIDQKFFR